MKNFSSIGQPDMVVKGEGGEGASLWPLHKYYSGAGYRKGINKG